MVVGRDGVFIRHIGKKSFSKKQEALEKKNQWSKVVENEIRHLNNDGGEDTIESE